MWVWVYFKDGLGLLWGRGGSGSQLGRAAGRDGFHGVLTCLEKPGFRHVNSPGVTLKLMMMFSSVPSWNAKPWVTARGG